VGFLFPLIGVENPCFGLKRVIDGCSFAANALIIANALVVFFNPIICAIFCTQESERFSFFATSLVNEIGYSCLRISNSSLPHRLFVTDFIIITPKKSHLPHGISMQQVALGLGGFVVYPSDSWNCKASALNYSSSVVIPRFLSSAISLRPWVVFMIAPCRVFQALQSRAKIHHPPKTCPWLSFRRDSCTDDLRHAHQFGVYQKHGMN
jgi:hypothetical protein